MRRYTTLQNVRAQKCPCSRAEWSELPCRTKPFNTFAEKYSSKLAKKYLQWSHRKKPKNHQLHAAATTKSRHDKSLAHTINVQTVTHGTSQRAMTSGRKTQV